MAYATIVAARDNNDETTSEISSYSHADSQQGQGHGKKKKRSSKYEAVENKLNDNWGKKSKDLDIKLNNILSRLGSPAAHETGNFGSEVDHVVVRNSSDQTIDRAGRRDAEVDYENTDTLSLLINRAERGPLIDNEDDDIDIKSDRLEAAFQCRRASDMLNGVVCQRTINGTPCTFCLAMKLCLLLLARVKQAWFQVKPRNTWLNSRGGLKADLSSYLF